MPIVWSVNSSLALCMNKWQQWVLFAIIGYNSKFRRTNSGRYVHAIWTIHVQATYMRLCQFILQHKHTLEALPSWAGREFKTLFLFLQQKNGLCKMSQLRHYGWENQIHPFDRTRRQLMYKMCVDLRCQLEPNEYMVLHLHVTYF